MNSQNIFYWSLRRPQHPLPTAEWFLSDFSTFGKFIRICFVSWKYYNLSLLTVNLSCTSTILGLSPQIHFGFIWVAKFWLWSFTCCTWMYRYLNVLECTWMYLNVLECTWMYLNVLECTWMYLNVLECSWMYLNVLECTWMYLDVLECTWMYLNVLECTWMYLNVHVLECTCTWM